MKITVCLKEVIDPALNLDFGLSHGVVFREGLPLKLNPNDATALALALDMKAANGKTEINVISIGGERVETYLRNALALGANQAMRIWDKVFTDLSPHLKAILLSKAATLSGADLVLLGAPSLDTGSGQVGQLVAGWLGLPYVSDVVKCEMGAGPDSVILLKTTGRGEREKLSCSLPAVVGIKGEGKLPYAPLDRLIAGRYADIALLSPADLGLVPGELNQGPARVTRLVFPQPPLTKAPPLDSSLPAFYRILQLLAGGIARRKGRLLEGSGDEIVEQLFRLLLEDGVIKKSKKQILKVKNTNQRQ
jgi:electron transfer flavoprotein beta subunit